MRFICQNDKCGKTFIHAAEQTEEDPQQNVVMKRVCPYCQSLDFQEYVEPVGQLVSVISVEIADVDSKLKEGYLVHEIFAKHAILTKKEMAK